MEGLKVMINQLWRHKVEETYDTLKNVINKKIIKVWLDEYEDKLKFIFEDGSQISIYDDGQSCCESRYMTTDYDLSKYSEATFLDIEIKDGGYLNEKWGYEHQIEFLDIKTNKGVFVIATHNEHNGYYGGFSIIAETIN
ncbi:MAG: DUF7448 domain-containing protein [Minisyncoccia bacterium]